MMMLKSLIFACLVCNLGAKQALRGAARKSHRVTTDAKYERFEFRGFMRWEFTTHPCSEAELELLKMEMKALVEKRVSANWREKDPDAPPLKVNNIWIEETSTRRVLGEEEEDFVDDEEGEDMVDEHAQRRLPGGWNYGGNGGGCTCTFCSCDSGDRLLLSANTFTRNPELATEVAGDLESDIGTKENFCLSGRVYMTMEATGFS